MKLTEWVTKGLCVTLIVKLCIGWFVEFEIFEDNWWHFMIAQRPTMC